MGNALNTACSNHLFIIHSFGVVKSSSCHMICPHKYLLSECRKCRKPINRCVTIESYNQWNLEIPQRQAITWTLGKMLTPQPDIEGDRALTYASLCSKQSCNMLMTSAPGNLVCVGFWFPESIWSPPPSTHLLRLRPTQHALLSPLPSKSAPLDPVPTSHVITSLTIST